MRFKLILYGGVVMTALALVLLPTIVNAAVVTCEPQWPDPHPNYYFYDVDPQNNYT